MATITIAPGQSIASAIAAAANGDTVQLRGGTYTERVNATLKTGMTLRNYPGEVPIIRGLLWLNMANGIVDGLTVLWDDATGAASEHMVKLKGGNGWIVRNCEFAYARSFACVLISSGVLSGTFTTNHVHHTYPSNSTNQDHNIYINDAANVLVTHCLIHDAPNGRNIKIGSLSPSDPNPDNIDVTYCTLVEGRGPANIQLSYAAKNCTLDHNILQGSGANNITGYNLAGTGNVATSNVGWDADGGAVSDTVSGHLTQSGNTYANPALNGSYAPSVTYAAYGHLASGATPPPSSGDTTPPTIGAVTSTPDSDSTVLTFGTSEPATATINYGTSTAYGSTASVGTPATAFNVELAGLAAGTDYYYRIRATDAAGNQSAYKTGFFSTIAAPATQVSLTGCTLTDDSAPGDTAASGSGAVTLQIAAPSSRFADGDAVLVDGTARATTYVSATRLDVALTADDRLNNSAVTNKVLTLTCWRPAP